MTQEHATAAGVLRDHFILGVKSRLEMPGEKFEVGWRHAVKQRMPQQKLNYRCKHIARHCRL
jgi:hypothetical protein